MTTSISFDEDGNEVFEMAYEPTSTAQIDAEQVHVDDGQIQIDAHNTEGHLTIRASGTGDTKFITCIDTDDDTEKAFTSTQGVIGSTAVATGILGVTGDAALQGTTDFGTTGDLTLEVSTEGVQINKELVLDDATFSTGGIALLKDAILGFKPYDGDTPLPAGNLYTFGRHSQIGDLTHDNDGICLRSINTVDGVEEAHTVLISPNPTDPNLVIHSQKNADFIKCISAPDDTTHVAAGQIKFRVDNIGHIHSRQITELTQRLENLDNWVSVLLHDNDAYPVPLGTVPDLKTTMNANNIAIPDDMFLNVFGGHVV